MIIIHVIHTSVWYIFKEDTTLIKNIYIAILSIFTFLILNPVIKTNGNNLKNRKIENFNFFQK